VNDESIISPIVDLFREILYDILGLFLPGAALIYVLTNSPFASVKALAEPLTSLPYDKGMALLIGASYVLGYAIQGLARTLWVWAVIRPARDVSRGMKGVSPAGLQVKKDIENSELFQAAKAQLGEYCGIAEPSQLSTNEVQNLAFSVAGDRAADAYNFSFRADLCSGMFLVCGLASLQTAFAVSLYLTWSQWFVTLTAYLILAVCFYLRAKVYFDIRGRIIFAIGLGVLAQGRNPQKD
jgi:hypothetical protein